MFLKNELGKNGTLRLNCRETDYCITRPIGSFVVGLALNIYDVDDDDDDNENRYNVKMRWWSEQLN